ncbi:hypothetical protein AG1IA_01573 [Rhizoctonia solani AG-1 IA]|uniref:Uncharacterized protein n=1 Tax=Thanatephorus cucumeris (strain AG1-IA) TaxID=983506 RepID=L8X5M5_THACA|nr:hypothetical protein AG1IA_01573 [Rhizoctonia solani AG-1 IA]
MSLGCQPPCPALHFGLDGTLSHEPDPEEQEHDESEHVQLPSESESESESEEASEGVEVEEVDEMGPLPLPRLPRPRGRSQAGPDASSTLGGRIEYVQFIARPTPPMRMMVARVPVSMAMAVCMMMASFLASRYKMRFVGRTSLFLFSPYPLDFTSDTCPDIRIKCWEWPTINLIRVMNGRRLGRIFWSLVGGGRIGEWDRRTVDTG